MEYIKGNPYFSFSTDKIKEYPYLNTDKTCELLIIGGGIDGAIANFYLSQKYDVILVEKERLGYSCTSCATALLEYQLDEFANDLKNFLSEEEIVLAYNMALSSMDKIEKFIKKYGNYCHYQKQPTFLYTNDEKFAPDIQNEFDFRVKNGFICELYTENNNPFTFPIKSGILCENGGCSFNPYLFEKQMIENSKNQDNIFENTHITKLEQTKTGYNAYTNFGEKISCKKVILATGFNWELVGKDDLCERFISYSIVTNPIKNFSWHKNALIHDVESPYHYLRQLPDNRIIYGGEDTPFKQKPINEDKANKIYAKLKEDLIKLFPNIKNLKIEYEFCGSFGATDNNLGIIGTSDISKNLLYFISCGANGIINSFAGAEIIDDIISNKDNPLIKLFNPNR